MAEQPRPKFELRKIYLKDLSFESPMAPGVFRKIESAPVIDVQLNVGHGHLEGNLYESVLVITVTGKIENQNAFLAEVHQAGIFEIVGVDQEKELPLALEVACPNILLPFAREAIADIVGKGGLPQLLLTPVNFEALYMRKQQQAMQPQSETSEETGSTKKASDKKKASETPVTN